MRETKQKKILHVAKAGFYTFYSAEDLFLKVNNNGISRATVYRFLNNLEKQGEIHSYFCNNRKIYSGNKNNHIHFTCEACNVIKHSAVRNVDFLQEIIDGDICHFQINVTGICVKCLKNLPP